MTAATIRRARTEDVEALFALLVRMFDEAPVAVPVADEGAALAWIERAITNGAVFIAEVGGSMVGSMGVEMKRFPWTTDGWLLNDTWFYVTPEYRESKIASALLKKIQHYVDETGLPFFGGISWGGKRVELKDRLIEMHGFTYVGGNFTYGLEEQG